MTAKSVAFFWIPVLIAATGCSTTNIYLPGTSQSTATQKTAQAPSKPIPWREVLSNPATVELLNMTPVPLAVSTNKPGWIRVPEEFQSNRMIVHMPTATVNGVSDFQVKKAGYVFLACNYDYQGNASGGWQETRWTKDNFVAEDWREVTEPELRGVLVDAENRQQIIFLKKLPQGATGRPLQQIRSPLNCTGVLTLERVPRLSTGPRSNRLSARLNRLATLFPLLC